MPFPCGMCGIVPWTTRGRSVWAWRHCPCVGKICHVARSPCSLRPIQKNVAFSGIKLPRTFLGSACPGQLVTHPRWRGLENARVGLLPLINSREAISVRVTNAQERSAIERTAREHKTQRDAKSTKSTSNPPQQKEVRSPKEGRNANTNRTANPETRPQALPSCVADFSASSFQKNPRTQTPHDVDVADELLDGHEDRVHLARGNLLVAGCRHLESTRQPRKRRGRRSVNNIP